jgi:hypothetical protein
MAASKQAFFIVEPGPSNAHKGMWPENAPDLIWGQGTPAAIAPFTTLNKGSFYAEVNGTDDESHCWMKVDEGGDAADWVKLLTSPYNIAQTYVDTELHGVEINQTATHISGASMVALNVAQTTAGTAGTWSAAVYAKITQGTAQNVLGYITAAEFEMINSCTAGGTFFVLTLNANNKSQTANSAYIAIRDYGSTPTNALFNLFDSVTADTTTAGLKLMTKASPTIAEINVAVRCMFGGAAGGTPFWLLGTKVTPN